MKFRPAGTPELLAACRLPRLMKASKRTAKNRGAWKGKTERSAAHLGVRKELFMPVPFRQPGCFGGAKTPSPLQWRDPLRTARSAQKSPGSNVAALQRGTRFLPPKAQPLTRPSLRHEERVPRKVLQIRSRDARPCLAPHVTGTAVETPQATLFSGTGLPPGR